MTSLRAEGEQTKSRIKPFLLAVGLAVAATQGWAYDRNLAITDIHTHGPPVLSQNVTKTIDLPAILAEDETQVATASLEGPENTVYRSTTLSIELKKLQDMHRSLIDLVPINPKTIRVARIIADQIPVSVAPSIGFDEMGNVFLHFKDERVDAYLTIEQRALHLFCKVVDQRNIYIDNEPFIGKRLPTKIRDKLSEIFVA
jgi:hypothetical protein